MVKCAAGRAGRGVRQQGRGRLQGAAGGYGGGGVCGARRAATGAGASAGRGVRQRGTGASAGRGGRQQGGGVCRARRAATGARASAGRGVRQRGRGRLRGAACGNGGRGVCRARLVRRRSRRPAAEGDGQEAAQRCSGWRPDHSGAYGEGRRCRTPQCRCVAASSAAWRCRGPGMGLREGARGFRLAPPCADTCWPSIKAPPVRGRSCSTLPERSQR